MKTGLSLTQLAAKIEGNRALKRDYIASTDALRMEVDTDQTPLLVLDRAHTQHGNDERHGILPIAHDQFAAHVGIDLRYYRRMKAEAPQLLATNLNHWLSAKPTKRMLRTLGGDVRAFLSNSYQRIENEHIAEVVLPILAGIPGVEIVSSEVTDTRMYIQAVTPTRLEVKLGDEVQAGVIISNSEVGLGSISVHAMMWRLACLNGLKVPADLFRAAHLGKRIEDNSALYKQDTIRAEDRAVLLKVRDHVTAAVDAVRFRGRVEKMAEFTGVRMTGSPEKAIEVLAQKLDVTEGERGGILRSLIEGGDLSAWGLINAVTHQAHTARDYDRAVEFEGMGGSLVELPRDQWKEILEAA